MRSAKYWFTAFALLCACAHAQNPLIARTRAFAKVEGEYNSKIARSYVKRLKKFVASVKVIANAEGNDAMYGINKRGKVDYAKAEIAEQLFNRFTVKIVNQIKNRATVEYTGYGWTRDKGRSKREKSECNVCLYFVKKKGVWFVHKYEFIDYEGF